MQTFSRYWRERERRLLGEEFSKVYRYPATPRTKMYDFYVLSYVGDLVERPGEYAPRGHMITLGDDVKMAAEEARDTIVRGLAAEMDADVFESIASEMRHAAVTADRMEESAYVLVGNKRIYLWQALKKTIKRGKDGRITFKYWDEDKEEEYWAMNLELHQTFGTNVKQMRADAKWLRGIYEGIEVDEGGFNPGDYKKVRERVGAERERFVRLAEKVFGDHHVFWGDEFELRVEWDAMSYAGEPWAAIARGWLGLKAARSVRDQAVQIDHIYDLQHNNGSVFNKLAKYDMGDGYEWLAEVLDYKRDVRSYYELIKNFVTGKMLVSSDCRVIALRAMKAVTGKTEEGAKAGDEKVQQETKSYKRTGKNGNTVYYKDKRMTVLHRVDGPAVKSADGKTDVWYLNGKLHRVDGPAIKSADGSEEWYLNGKLHREGGLPAVKSADGSEEWYLNGKRHREGGLPAVEEADGYKEWYLNGKRHNADGPAVEQLNGRLQYWFLNGKSLSKEEWEKQTGKKSKTYSERLGVQQETKSYKKTVNGNTMYYKDEAMKVLHREDGPAVVSADGTEEWYLNGKRHRAGSLPAIEEANDGDKAWYLNGQLHCEDGPAIEYAHGDDFWYLNGQPLSKKEWEKRTGKKSKTYSERLGVR